MGPDFLLCFQANWPESDRKNTKVVFLQSSPWNLTEIKGPKTPNYRDHITVKPHRAKQRSSVKWGGSKRTWHRALFTGGKSAVMLLPPSASPALELSPLIWPVQPPIKRVQNSLRQRSQSKNTEHIKKYSSSGTL